MKEQPEALRLADLIQSRYGNDINDEAAAELRRLSAENESLRQIVNDFPPVEAELREVSDRAHRLEAQRDALLEFAKYVEAIDPNNPAPLFEKARAAIKAVEEQK